MLILLRKRHESIVIGHGIRVTVRRVIGHRLCLWIRAEGNREVWLSQGDEIEIAPYVKVKLMGLHGVKAVLGIEAPQGMLILRSELMDRPQVAGAPVRPGVAHGA